MAFIVIEILAGLQAHSLSLLSDAGHNFTDALALLLAWFGVYFGRKPPDTNRTYGYHRAGVLAAFLNALSLLLLSGYILYESYLRWLDPQVVNELTMMIVATLGWRSTPPSCGVCTARAARTSTCAARGCTCWAMRSARWRSSEARW